VTIVGFAQLFSSHLLILEPLAAKFQRPGILGDGSHHMFRGTGGDFGPDLRGNRHLCLEQAREVSKYLLGNAAGIAAKKGVWQGRPSCGSVLAGLPKVWGWVLRVVFDQGLHCVVGLGQPGHPKPNMPSAVCIDCGATSRDGGVFRLAVLLP
jgi:hypothetical protein